MYYVAGVLGLVFVMLGLAAATLAGRHFGARALGVRGLGFLSNGQAEAYLEAPRSHRWFARLAGPLAAYGFASSLFFVALLQGRAKATTEVDPIAAGSASAAGIQPGDRIVAIDGRPTSTWKEVRLGIQDSSRTTLEVRIERKGKSSVIRVTRSPEKTIGITPRIRDVEVSFGEAVSLALSRPLSVMRALAEDLFSAAKGEPVTVTGPVGVVREVERSARRRWREYFELLAILASCWPGSLGVELFLTPRRRPPKVDAPPKFE